MSSPDETPPAAEVGSLIRRSGRSGLGRWLKPTVTFALYVLVFYWIDAREISSTLKTAQFGIAGACVLLYMAGQAISTLKWRILLAPVHLSTPYLRLLGFYFTGMKLRRVSTKSTSGTTTCWRRPTTSAPSASS